MRFSVRAVRAVVLGLAACLAGAAPAAAIPVSVYGDGTTPQGGFDPNDVQNAINQGASAPTVVEDIDRVASWLEITTPDGIPGTKGKNKQNPSRGTSTWTLHIDDQAPAEALQDVALVILGHSLLDPIKKYKDENVGLEIDTELPWLFVTEGGVISVAGEGPGGGLEGEIYVAFFLGDLEAGGEYEIPIEYLLGQKLKKKNGTFIFPLYSYGVVANVPAPEPSTLALLALGALAVGLAARRAR
jgi:hypothetical protein